jgi:hypothetical protein
VFDTEVPPEETLGQAIRKKVCVTAHYNRVNVTLAPHSLFTRHDDLFLRAVTVEHDGRKPREPKLGTFKVKGLSEIVLTRKLFSPGTVFKGLEPAAAVVPVPVPAASEGVHASA